MSNELKPLPNFSLNQVYKRSDCAVRHIFQGVLRILLFINVATLMFKTSSAVFSRLTLLTGLSLASRYLVYNE